jgi:PAS domain S-box-containing protein
MLNFPYFFLNLNHIQFAMSADSSKKGLWLTRQFSKKSSALRLVSITALSAVIILSSLDIAGWIFGIGFLKSFSPSWEPMKLITALSFACLSLSLLSIQLHILRPGIMILSGALAVIICFVSISSLYTYFYFFSKGHDLLINSSSFFNMFLQPSNKMAFLTAINFFLIGCIILLFQFKKGFSSGIAHFIIIPVFLISYFTVVSYLLGVSDATEIGHVSVALNSGLAFCGLCLAALIIRPDTWLMKIFISDEIAGFISRRLLAPLIILPVVIGWLRLQGERSGVFNSEQGVIIVATTYTMFFILLVWLTARNVNKIDLKRRITEKNLRDSEERFKAIAEASPVGIGVVDQTDGSFLYINPSYEQYFGYQKDELLSIKTPEIYCDQNDRKKIVEILMDNNFVSNYEVKLKRKDGSSFWSISSISHITFRHKPALLGTFIDITKRKQADELLSESEQRLIERTHELELVNLKLQNELKERIKVQEALRKSERELIELNATKDKFFNIVAHDLKNPFTSLIGSSELLYQNIDSIDTDNIKKLASILNDSAKSGYSILQNLLDWSRSQTGLLKIAPRNINLRELIYENILNMQLLATNKQISILNEITSDILIVSDKNMINTVLRNLLSNAIKFTPRLGKVIVSVNKGNDFVNIFIKDNGIGISPENIGNLFNIDTKNSSPGTENEQGTGLGLKLSREFAEKLGGRIRVESIAGEGSEFSLTLPVNGSGR